MLLQPLIEIIDNALGNDFDQPATLFYIDDHGKSFDLGMKRLPEGVHPMEELAGFVAPSEWDALGVVAHGWASRDLDQPRPSRARDRVRVRCLHLVSRDGDEAGGYRLADGSDLHTEPAVGRIRDALRTALGLPSPATAELN